MLTVKNQGKAIPVSPSGDFLADINNYLIN